MKYQKGFAEIIRFDKQEVFAIISKGKLCNYYGKIDEEICYEVSVGSHDPFDNWYNSKCEDVTGSDNPCPVIRCFIVNSTIDIVS